MDPILSEVYSTVLPAAPYVLAAYVGILLTLFAFVFSLWRKSKRTEADIDALKRALEDRERARVSSRAWPTRAGVNGASAREAMNDLPPRKGAYEPFVHKLLFCTHIYLRK